MAVKKYKPTSPGRRFMAVSSFEDVTKKAPSTNSSTKNVISVSAMADGSKASGLKLSLSASRTTSEAAGIKPGP